MKRPRLRLRTRPVVPQLRRGLWLTDTPRPGCLDCAGDGWVQQDYGDEDGYAGTHEWLCRCWSGVRMWLIVPMPRARRRPPGYSDEPPF